MSETHPLHIYAKKKMSNLKDLDFPSGQKILDDLYLSQDPLTFVRTGKVMVKAWANHIKDDLAYLSYAHTFLYHVILSYWGEVNSGINDFSIPKLTEGLKLTTLDESIFGLAKAIGSAASKLDLIEASYQLGNIYTAVLPESKRSSQGIFYTPPVLTNRLLSMVEDTGLDWSTAKVVDPACGGGAFLAPVALRMLKALNGKEPHYIIKHIEKHLSGFELDPFGAWLSQVFLDVALKDVIKAAGVRIDNVITVCDSLATELTKEEDRFDLVIGNPPYGKVKLNQQQRERYNRSLYGHANYYGLFTDLSLNLVKQGGTIGYVTPTSFLSGEYFKKLRSVLRREALPVEIDFVLFRKGVFEDVLQETMLTTYIKTDIPKKTVKVNHINPVSNNDLQIQLVGNFHFPGVDSDPWILARSPLHLKIVSAMGRMKCNLKSWGYKVSTGPLVWNRHKEQLHKRKSASAFPVLWAESITPEGKFFWKAEKKNHLPYFKFKAGDEWLLTHKPCILLQRTTAKEQHKRLIAASLPAEFIKEKGGVVVENHLNMILPIPGATPLVGIDVLSGFLNSKVVNDAFRCVSGSVAVSAYELESLPLPDPSDLGQLQSLMERHASQADVEMECLKIYSI